MDRDYSSKEDTSAGDGNFEIEGIQNVQACMAPVVQMLAMWIISM